MRSSSFRVGGIALILLSGLALAGLVQALRASPPREAAGTLTLTNAVDELPAPGGKVEAPVLSPQGDRVALVVDEYENEALHLKVGSVWTADRADGAWREPRLERQGSVEAVGLVDTYFHPSFAPDGATLLYNHVQVATKVFVPKASTLRSWVELGSDARRWEAEALGLHGEILEHPRLSPDGAWMVFYVKRKPETRGIWLLHPASGRLVRISDQDDKHPVWSPDGTKVLFHHQVGGDALDRVPPGTPEQSTLGCIDLALGDPAAVTFTRVLLDPPTAGFRYHKHPMLLADGDLLLFHGAESPGGELHLMARRLRPGSPVTRLDFVQDGRRMEKSKHPSTAGSARVALFVGSFKGAPARVYQLRPDALDRLEKELR